MRHILKILKAKFLGKHKSTNDSKVWDELSVMESRLEKLETLVFGND